MSKKHTKRSSEDFHRSPSFDEEARHRIKHQSLMQDFSELQKEFVSKKKKLLITKQKSEVLFAEVGFLRKRYRYLMEIQSRKLQLEHDPGAQNSSVQSVVAGKPLKVDKQRKKDQLISRKDVGKKKISWQDQVALKL